MFNVNIAKKLSLEPKEIIVTDDIISIKKLENTNLKITFSLFFPERSYLTLSEVVKKFKQYKNIDEGEVISLLKEVAHFIKADTTLKLNNIPEFVEKGSLRYCNYKNDSFVYDLEIKKDELYTLLKNQTFKMGGDLCL